MHKFYEKHSDNTKLTSNQIVDLINNIPLMYFNEPVIIDFAILSQFYSSHIGEEDIE